MKMAARAFNGCSVNRPPAYSPPPLSLSAFFCSFQQFRPLHFGIHSKLGESSSNCRFELHFNGNCGSIGTFSVHSLVDSVLEELQERRRTRTGAGSNKLGVIRSEELVTEKIEKPGLRGGLLLEFKKDAERVLLAVAQKPDGKKNWMVSDQNGTKCSIKPQQITYVVPGVDKFDHTQIPDFLQKAQDNLDLSLLELAWAELLEMNKSVTPEELAEMIYGIAEPLESYCAHVLLSKDEIYFYMLESKGYYSVYAPRPTDQVEELLKRRLAKETAEKQLQEFIQLLYSAKARPVDAKPSKSSWILEEKTRDRIEALVSYAVDECCSASQMRTAGMILTAMGMAKTATSALNLLIDIGYFPVHVNLDLMKSNIRTDHSEGVLSAADDLLSESCDVDKIRRRDLTYLKVYAIDVDEADEGITVSCKLKLSDDTDLVWGSVSCRVNTGTADDLPSVGNVGYRCMQIGYRLFWLTLLCKWGGNGLFILVCIVWIK